MRLIVPGVTLTVLAGGATELVAGASTAVLHQWWLASSSIMMGIGIMSSSSSAAQGKVEQHSSPAILVHGQVHGLPWAWLLCMPSILGG